MQFFVEGALKDPIQRCSRRQFLIDEAAQPSHQNPYANLQRDTH